MWRRRHTAHTIFGMVVCTVKNIQTSADVKTQHGALICARSTHRIAQHIELLIRIVKSLRQSLLREPLRACCCHTRATEKLKEHLWQIYPAIKQ